MSEKSLICLVITTVSSKEKAQEMAKSMVLEKFAACAQVSQSIESHYIWNEKYESSEEWKITFKTLSKKVRDLEDEIRNIHPYDIPEIVRISTTLCDPKYEEWVLKQLESG